MHPRFSIYQSFVYGQKITATPQPSGTRTNTKIILVEEISERKFLKPWKDRLYMTMQMYYHPQMNRDGKIEKK
jgi:hypothetical protein